MDIPTMASAAAHAAFEAHARTMGLRPEHPWIRDYVDYEWTHLRHVLNALPCALAGRRVLEFGCNAGASAIVLALLGARVAACDIDMAWVRLARLNALRYGRGDIDFFCIPDTRSLPWQDGQFDLVACNSVLEYVAPDQLPSVQQELARVLRSGGLLLVTGTSNRLWPREVHSGRWLTNYLPRRVASPASRGVWPWTIRYGFGPGWRNLDDARRFARARRAMSQPAWQIACVRLFAALLRTSPGLLAPNLSCLLSKPAH